jgi:outer membrane cobalamin receptor
MRQGMSLCNLLTFLMVAHASAAATVQEQVVVTASRLEEAGQSLPLAWSSIDEGALGITGAVHVNEIMQRVPGAWIARGNGQESLPALRSPVLTGAGSCGAFFMSADSIALRAAGFCNVNQLMDANVEQAGRIEVIRGPATALYGSNAMHGVINVLSAPPTPSKDHELALEAGPHDYYRGKYHYRNTFGPHGISINFNGSTDGGYKDDSGYDQQKATLRHDYEGALWAFSTVRRLRGLQGQRPQGYQPESRGIPGCLVDEAAKPRQLDAGRTQYVHDYTLPSRQQDGVSATLPSLAECGGERPFQYRPASGSQYRGN